MSGSEKEGKASYAAATGPKTETIKINMEKLNKLDESLRMERTEITVETEEEVMENGEKSKLFSKHTT